MMTRRVLVLTRSSLAALEVRMEASPRPLGLNVTLVSVLPI